jgi:hypothetical protein
MKLSRALLLSTLFALVCVARAEGTEHIKGGVRPERSASDVRGAINPLGEPKVESDVSPRAFKPNILSGEAWKARKPISGMKEHKPRYLTIHHTASPQNAKASLAQKMSNLQHFSQKDALLATGRFKPAWADVPYHFYIDVNGEIAEGRETKYVGDTNTPYDPTGHIQIVLEGNFEQEEPSTRQLQSLEQLTVWLSLVWRIDPSLVKGHKDYIGTACPGKNLETKLPGLRQKVAHKLDSVMTSMEKTGESNRSR